MKLRLTLAVFALATTSVASAQKVTVGPNLNAPTSPHSLLFSTHYQFQSMRVPVSLGSSRFTYLKLKFWFEGAPIGNKNYYTEAYLTPDPYSPQDAWGFKFVDQNIHGYADFIIRNPGWATGQTLWMILSSDYTEHYFDQCGYAGPPQDAFCSFPTAHTQITNADTYADGSFYYCDPDPVFTPECELGRDMLFEATFVTTPEPATLVLLASGLLGIGVVAARRRRTPRNRA